MKKRKHHIIMSMKYDLIYDDSFILKPSILFLYQQYNDKNRLFNKYKKKKKIRLLM